MEFSIPRQIKITLTQKHTKWGRERQSGGRERERERELELATERSDAASEAQSSKERGGLSKLF